MSVIGKLNMNGPKGYPEGYIQTLQLKLSFWLEETYLDGHNTPFYMIVTSSPGGSTQIGAVWKKTFQKPGQPMAEFFSMTFDDPSFPHPLNVAAFKNSAGEYEISYRRRQDRKAA